MGALVGLSVGSAVRPVRVRADANGAYNVRDHGAFGDGIADDTQALQALISSVPTRSCIYFPTGHYKVTATLDCGTGAQAKGLTFKGDGQGKPGNQYQGGSVVRGNVAGPLLKTAYPASGVTITDLGFNNINALGVALQVGGNSLFLDRLSIAAYRGIWAPENTFTMSVSNVQCVWNGFPIGSVGIQTSGHCSIRAADVVGFDHGIRACGLGVDIRSCRIEVNRTGLMLGMTHAGGNSNLTGAVIEALSLEANDTAIHCNVLTGASVRGIGIQGTVNSPSGGSVRGIYAGIAKATEFQGIIISNSYSDAAVKIQPQFGTQRWSNCIVGNVHATGKKWDIPDPTGIVLEQCP